MRRILFWLTASLLVLVILGAVAQLVLPGIAAQRIRDRLAHSGRVLDVSVEAFPAIELLWHHADTVVVRMATYRSDSASLATYVSQVADVGTLDASAQVLQSGALRVRDASLHKRGSQLTGSATVTEADLRASLPVIQSVAPVDSSAGQLTLRGTGTLLGLTATIDATVRAQNGDLIVSPDLPFGGLATITLFSSPAVAVEDIEAAPARGGFVATVHARIR